MTARLTSIGASACMLALTLSLTGCLAWRVTLISGPAPRDWPLNTIAMAPEPERFTDLVGFALAEGGYTIVDSGMTLALLVLLQERTENVLTPQVMAAFRQRGIDAVLMVNWTERQDELLRRATAYLYSTQNGLMLCQVEWRAGWQERGPAEAAWEIAKAMIQCLERPPDNAQLPHPTADLRKPLRR